MSTRFFAYTTVRRSIPACVITLFICLFVIVSMSHAQQTIRGYGRYNNSPMLMLDRKTPDEGTAWNSDQCVWWEEKETNFVINIGNGRELVDLRLQVDSDDTYKVEVSEDGTNWTLLLTIKPEYGTVQKGMDTFCTNAEDPEYVKEIDFEPLRCTMIRLSAEGGNGEFAISEVRIHSTLLE